MTSGEALAGFGRLQQHFKGHGKYKGADLNPIWADLLPCSVEAFNRALGIIMKNGKFLPEPAYVLEQTLFWEKKMGGAMAAKAVTLEELGREAIVLLRQRYDGTLAPEEYVARLYRLSEKTGNAEYAEAARREERRLNKGEQHGG